jgi:hypothetical protein
MMVSKMGCLAKIDLFHACMHFKIGLVSIEPSVILSRILYILGVAYFLLE